MSKFYIQLDSEDIIQDVIEYPHEGYVEVEIEGTLPAGINGGWFKWENGTYVEVPELKPVDKEAENEKRIADLEAAMAAILGGAM